MALVLLIPLVAGAIYAAVADMKPQDSWAKTNSGGGQAAPAVASSGIDSQQLIAARRAAGTAGSQASLLTAGTKQLTDGTQQLVDKSGDFTKGTQKAVDGSQEITDGLVQLQAGTGQLASGANQVADGVDKVYDQVQGIAVMQMQLLGAIDNASAELQKTDSQGARDAQAKLADIKAQLVANGVSGSAVDDLTRLRDGSREVANQLSQPGQAYHDGIYKATEGSKTLTAGLRDLNTGAGQAADGINKLNDGAKKIDDMAKANGANIQAVSRALPGSSENQASGGQAAPAKTRDLSPSLAFLIAALVVVGAGAIYAVMKHYQPGSRVARVLVSPVLVATVVMGALGATALYVLRPDSDVARITESVVVLALAGLMSAVLTRACFQLWGRVIGGIALIAGLIVQVGIVGWVWQRATSDTVPEVWRTVSWLMPLHYPTAALTSANNSGTTTSLWVPVVVMAVLCVIGLVWRPRAVATATVDN